MIVELTAAPADRIEADGVAVFLHTDDRPPPGAVGLLDWRLNGVLSRFLKEGWYRAAPGELLLVAPGRRVRAPRLLVVGLGLRRAADAGRLRAASAQALAALAPLGVERLALGLPGPGEPPVTEAERAASLVQGLLDAAQGTQPPRPPGRETGWRPHVMLLVPEAAQPDAAALLARVKSSLGPGSPFDLRPLPASRPVTLSR